MYKRLVYLIFSFFPLSGLCQEHAPAETPVLMKREVTGSMHFNTSGWGIGASYGFQKNYKYKNTASVLFTNIRHEKEQKIYPDQILNSRGYFYGKLNSLVSLRLTYGGKLVLFKSRRDNGIEISAKWDAGVSLGLLKPVYLRIDKLNSTIDERYDPTFHNSANISSRSSWAKGLGESQFVPGVHGRLGFDFNFSAVRDAISGGEFGVMVDYFFNDNIEILYNNPAKNYFTCLYLQFNFGRRLY